MIFLKLKVENGKLKIEVGGVPPQSIREDTRIKELHQMPEYGIDAIFALYFALYESKCILVGVALRPQVKAEIVCQNKFYKYHASTT